MILTSQEDDSSSVSLNSQSGWFPQLLCASVSEWCKKKGSWDLVCFLFYLLGILQTYQVEPNTFEYDSYYQKSLQFAFKRFRSNLQFFHWADLHWH